MQIIPLNPDDQKSTNQRAEHLPSLRLKASGIRIVKEPHKKITQEELDKLFTYLSSKVFFIRAGLFDKLQHHLKISEDLNKFAQPSKIKSALALLSPPKNIGSPLLLEENVGLLYGINALSVLSKKDFCDLAYKIENKEPSLAREFVQDMWYQAFYGMEKTKCY